MKSLKFYSGEFLRLTWEGFLAVIREAPVMPPRMETILVKKTSKKLSISYSF